MQLALDGTEYTMVREANLMTYIGDSMVSTYDLLDNQDIPESQVVFLEATHVGLDAATLARAKHYGHTDLSELSEVVRIYTEKNPNCQILLKHFSNKYGQDEINRRVHGSYFPDNSNVHVLASNE